MTMSRLGTSGPDPTMDSSGTTRLLMVWIPDASRRFVWWTSILHVDPGEQAAASGDRQQRWSKCNGESNGPRCPDGRADHFEHDARFPNSRYFWRPRRQACPRDGKAQAEQVRAVSVDRIGSAIGFVPAATMAEVDDALRLHLAL